MTTTTVPPRLEVFYFSVFCLYHWVLWILGMCVVSGILSDSVQTFGGGLLEFGLVLLLPTCISMAWCSNVIRKRTIRKNIAFFVAVFLKVWLLCLIVLLAVVKMVSDVFWQTETASYKVMGWSCVLVALGVSIVWTYNRVKREYLMSETFPQPEIMDVINLFVTKRS